MGSRIARRICNILTATDIRSWTDIPTAILQSELARRQNRDVPERPACGGKNKGSYNTSIHVGALVLILALSTIGMNCLLQLLLYTIANVTLQHAPFLSSPVNTLNSQYLTSSSSSRAISGLVSS